MLIFPLLAALLIASTEASFQNRIRIESSKVFIKYEHQMNGKNAGFHQTVNTSLFNNTQIFDCSKDAFTFCLKWGEIGQFKITVYDKCEDYEFSSKLEGSLRIRFDISNVHIYGGFEQDFQKWPMDYDEYEEYPFVSTDRYTKGVLEPYWLVSNGLYLYVDEKTPLFITQNKGKGVLELIAEKKAPYIRNGDTILKYRVCKFDDMKQAHMHAVANILGKPNGIPDRKMVQYPIWSTWAKYKMNISESIVIQFANLIKQYTLPNSQLELDDRWETCYGSTEIDTSTFPDMKSLVSRLKSMGFRVTMWMHPFINTICEPHHTQALQQGYLVKSAAGETVIDWWNGKGSVIDFTNPKAVAWFSQKVKKIQNETGIDSFKFDAGESAYSPQVPIFHRMAEDHPETHLKAYVKAVSAFGDMVEVRSSRRTQTLPIFVRMMDRDTNWDKRLGLSTLIPTLLQMNIIGYPFVLPDMVGGNGYDDASVTKEMFVRWLQINVFMPSLQFSYPPWDFDNEVLDLTRKFINLHAKYTDKIIEAMIQAKEKGTPVNPPIWWIDPTDPVAQNIGTEFLLGEDILVAPVIEQGAQSRDIYLPRGIWRDETNNETELIKGPIWLYNYPANLHTLPYFTKIRDIDESKNSASNVPTSGNLIICATVVVLVTILNQL